MFSLISIVHLAWCCIQLTSFCSADRPWENDFKLSEHVVPEVYNLLLHPNLEENTFSGSVDITLKITSNVDYIALHNKNLNIEKTVLSASTNKTNLVKNAFAFPKNEFWVVELKDPLSEGSYNLSLKFNGSLTGDIVGFYKSTYNDVSGESRNIATTKFEPTYARRAFPCFDEPSFKARYNVKLVRPSGNNYFALSNMNQLKEESDSPSEGLTTVTFATSVPMSTYLACFIVCDFEHLPPKKSKHGFDITVYARNGQINKMEYTLQNAVATVDYYIDYFSIDYPLPKLDLIAIPDFVSGAMENWGLITYRETSVLYDPRYNTDINKLSITLTTTHEIAHMWFGNLVTMSWWDDLWLNEGFASFLEFKGSAHLLPDWDFDTIFIWYLMTDALSLDSTLSSHPIIKHVSHPDKITEIFDRISYSKGASILRMLESFLGEENFRQGVVSYLKTFSYKNAETKDLWHHLQKFSSGVNVERVMDTWTRQMGAPVLIVSQDGNNITVKQQRFTTDKNAVYDSDESPYNYKWDVPVTYITSSNNKSTLKWLKLEDPSLNIDVKDVKWYKLNWHYMGYYRVLYPVEHWQTLSNVLVGDIKALDAADRANLVEDVFVLAESGHLDYSNALSFINFLQKEDHFVVWAHASHHLLNIESRLRNTPIYNKYREYLTKLIRPLLKDSLWGFSSDGSILNSALQVRLLTLACKLQIPEFLNKAKELFSDRLENNGPKPHVEIQTIVYNYGLAEGGESQWDKMWDRYLAESDPQEKIRIRNALAATKNEALIKKLIDLAKNEQYIRSQDYFSLMAQIAQNPHGNAVLWDYVRANWKYLVDRFTLNNRSFGQMLPIVVKMFSTEERLNEVERFLVENPEEGAGAAGRKSSIESIKLNILWLKRHLPTLTEWLKSA